MKVLVVDDAGFQRKHLVRELTNLGHEVSEAPNGEEGLKAVEAQRPDLVLCDLNMPVMDGFRFLFEVGQRGLDVPVVTLSADIQSTSKERALSLGARDFLNKPCTKADLAAMLDRVFPGAHP
jgi:twitching motility two-component system response regulator PilH